MKLLFGKYKDSELHEVPDAYLDWLFRQAWLDPELSNAVCREINRREHVAQLPPDLDKFVFEILKTGYHACGKSITGGDSKAFFDAAGKDPETYAPHLNQLAAFVTARKWIEDTVRLVFPDFPSIIEPPIHEQLRPPPSKEIIQ